MYSIVQPSVQFSCSVMSDSLRLYGLQHARLPCPSTPGVNSNSHPSSWWCHPTISSSGVPFSSCLQSFPAPGFYSNESVLCIRWPKYWSFSFSISPSNEHPGLVSFRMDWLDLLAVQGTLKSLQHHSSIVSILWCSIFFIVQLSYPYMATGKTIALTRRTFVGKAMSLLFNMLQVCHCFSSKEKASFNFIIAVTICSDFRAQENKVFHCFHCFPHLFAMKWWDRMPWSSFLNVEY